MLVQSEKKKIPILMYHSISESDNPKFKQFCVSPELFAAHMAYLHEHAYTPLTVTQFINMRTHRKDALPEWPVIVTFDDGFADFFSGALPVLQHYGFGATLYVATAFINSTSRWMQLEGEGARMMLTWDQLIEINQCGIECGAHSHRHSQLDILPLAEAREEIVQCKWLLEDRLDQKVLSFAYPHGYHSAAIQRLVREAGYTSACAVQYVMSSETTDPFGLARLFVQADTDVDAFATLLAMPIPSAATTLYVGGRVPLWRLARRYTALIHNLYQKDSSL